jgi:penicillin-binding protein 1A
MLFTEEYTRSFIQRALLQKPREFIIAVRLEKQYTKEEIIALYLNRYDFLNQAVGVKSAAQIYFNKPVDSLRVEESAMLVGMLKNSSLYNPLRRKDLVIKRREVVLSQMVKNDFLSPEQYDSLRLMPLGLDFKSASHVEGMAPYFREVLRQEVKNILNEKDSEGNFLRTKSDGSNYDLYSDGLKVYTTIDSRMQEYAEEAVQRHLAGELQPDFDKDLKRRKDENYPFYNGINAKDRDRILQAAVKQSDRYKILVGSLCPDCNRPAAYITEMTNDQGEELFHCDEEKGGCSHTWHITPRDSIPVIFDTPTNMKVFSYQGDVDTLMSPMDSIRYHKSILHAGLMSMDPSTGFVKAWVGGVDYKHFQYDNVYQMRRQVGSTFKPFVYATALRFGMHPCEELPNQKICITLPGDQPQWCPDNSDFEYGNMVTLEHALANSINTITAYLIKKYGTQPVIELAHDLGIKSEIPPYPSIALGVAELSLFEIVAANAALVNKGVYIEPIFITRIEDKNGNPIFEAVPETREAMDERTAYITVEMMKGVVDGAYNREKDKSIGTGMRLRMDLKSREYDNIPYPMAGKTGTTQNNTDGWFMGLTPDLVTGVWVGAADPTVRFSRTSLGQGANSALPIYGYYMHDVYDDNSLDVSKEDFEKPDFDIGINLNCTEYYSQSNSIKFDDSNDKESEDELFE